MENYNTSSHAIYEKKEILGNYIANQGSHQKDDIFKLED
jgi:hypothetical protein